MNQCFSFDCQNMPQKPPAIFEAEKHMDFGLFRL